MSEHLLNPNALRASQPRQLPPNIPLGDGIGLYGFSLVPVMAEDGETVRVVLMADVGRLSIITQTVEVARVVLGDYGTTTATELRAKYFAATTGKPVHTMDGDAAS